MGIFSRTPVSRSNVSGTIDRISDMGSDHIDFVIRLTGSRKLYRVFWMHDGRDGYSLYLTKPGDSVTMTVADGQDPARTIRADTIVNHSYG